MSNTISILVSPLRHTYPFGVGDRVAEHGTVEQMRSDIASCFAEHPDCRRVIVAAAEDNLEEIAACEQAGLRYVVDVQTRDHEAYSLMVAEPDWVVNQPCEIDEMELK